MPTKAKVKVEFHGDNLVEFVDNVLSNSPNAKTLLKDSLHNQVAEYAFVGEDGSLWLADNTACHAEMGYPYRGYGHYCDSTIDMRNYLYSSAKPPKVPMIVGVVNLVQFQTGGHQKLIERYGDKIDIAFAEWMANFSPYAPAYALLDQQEIFDRGLYVLDASKTASHLVGGMIAARVISEYVDIAATWYELVDRGVHPNVAFFFAHFWGSGGKFAQLYNTGHNGHCAIDGSKTTEFTKCCINFITKDERLLDPKPWNQALCYEKINAAWKGPRDRAPTFVKKLNEALASAVEGGPKKKNPFAKLDEEIGNYPEFKKGLDVATPLLNEFFRPFIQEQV